MLVDLPQMCRKILVALCCAGLFVSCTGCGGKKDSHGVVYLDAPLAADLIERPGIAHRVVTYDVVQTGHSNSLSAFDADLGKLIPGPDGKPYAWVGKKNWAVRFFLPFTSDQVLTVRCFPYFRWYLDQSMTVLINGVKVHSTPMKAVKIMADYKITVPPGVLVYGENVVEFRMRYLSRRLKRSVAVESIRFKSSNPALPGRAHKVSPNPDGTISLIPSTRLCWPVEIPDKAHLLFNARFNQTERTRKVNVFLREAENRLFLGSILTDGESRIGLPDFAGRHGVLEIEHEGLEQVYLIRAETRGIEGGGH